MKSQIKTAKGCSKLGSRVVAIAILAIVALLPHQEASAQDYAVIVHPSNTVGNLDQSDVVRIFLGRSHEFPGGGNATAVNSDESSATRTGFEQAVLGKSSDQMQAYWAKQMFSGQGRPPEEVGQDADVLSYVAANADAIGYVPASMVDGSVKVVFQQ